MWSRRSYQLCGSMTKTAFITATSGLQWSRDNTPHCGVWSPVAFTDIHRRSIHMFQILFCLLDDQSLTLYLLKHKFNSANWALISVVGCYHFRLEGTSQPRLLCCCCSRDQVQIWNLKKKIYEKFLNRNFKNLFHSFVHTGTSIMCVKFHENRRKTVEVAISKVWWHSHRQTVNHPYKLHWLQASSVTKKQYTVAISHNVL